MQASYYLVLSLLYLWVFIIGACIGSFLNVLIYRIPENISIAKGRSFCPHCHHMIRAKDNIPLISWLLLKGKCRDCGKAISKRYPLVELLTAVVFTMSFLRWGFSAYSILVCAALAILIAVAYIDKDTMTIPNSLIIALLVVAIISLFTGVHMSLFSRFIGAICISLPMLILTLLVPGAFGGGDMKLMVAAGFMLGWQGALVATFIAILGAGSKSIYFLLSGHIKVGTHIPFGPYLSFGIGIVLLYGNIIINWYAGLI